MKDRVGDGKLIKIMASPPPPQVFGCGAIAPMKSAPRGDWEGGGKCHAFSRARAVSHNIKPRVRTRQSRYPAVGHIGTTQASVRPSDQRHFRSARRRQQREYRRRARDTQ